MADAAYNDDQLQVTHFNCGKGQGSIEIKHLPTGIAVSADLGTVPVMQVQRNLLAQLEQRLAVHNSSHQGTM